MARSFSDNLPACYAYAVNFTCCFAEGFVFPFQRVCFRYFTAFYLIKVLTLTFPLFRSTIYLVGHCSMFFTFIFCFCVNDLFRKKNVQSWAGDLCKGIEIRKFINAMALYQYVIPIGKFYFVLRSLLCEWKAASDSRSFSTTILRNLKLIWLKKIDAAFPLTCAMSQISDSPFQTQIKISTTL